MTRVWRLTRHHLIMMARPYLPHQKNKLSPIIISRLPHPPSFLIAISSFVLPFISFIHLSIYQRVQDACSQITGKLPYPNTPALAPFWCYL